MSKDTFELVKDGLWSTPEGDHIIKVNPRGMTLYALHRAGERRPTWHDSLKKARNAARRT